MSSINRIFALIKEFECKKNIYTTMYTIKTNKSGTRSMEISEEHLLTIEKYQLLSSLVGSNGIVDEGVLDKLKLTIRSLIVSQDGSKELLDLCIDVIYHNNMKALGLSALIELYKVWKERQTEEEESNRPSDEC